MLKKRALISLSLLAALFPPLPRDAFSVAYLRRQLQNLQNQLPFPSALLQGLLRELEPRMPEEALLRELLLGNRSALKNAPPPREPLALVAGARLLLGPAGAETPLLSVRRKAYDWMLLAWNSGDLWARFLLRDFFPMTREALERYEGLFVLDLFLRYLRGRTHLESALERLNEGALSHPDALQDVGSLLDRVGDERAKDYFSRALTRLPAGEASRRVYLLAKLGRYEELVAFIRELVERDPQGPLLALAGASLLAQKPDPSPEDWRLRALLYRDAGKPFRYLRSLQEGILAAGENAEDAAALRALLPDAVGRALEEMVRLLVALGLPAQRLAQTQFARNSVTVGAVLYSLFPENTQDLPSFQEIQRRLTPLHASYLAYLLGQCTRDLPRAYRTACREGAPPDEEFLEDYFRTADEHALQFLADLGIALRPLWRELPHGRALGRLLARTLAWYNRWADALTILQPLSTAFPDAELAYLRGSVLLELRRWEDAEKAFREAQKLGYQDVWSLTRKLARAVAKQGRIRDAIRILNEGVKPVPEAIPLYQDILAFALEYKAWKTAERTLRILMELDPGNGLQYERSLLQVYLQSDQLEAARPLLEAWSQDETRLALVIQLASQFGAELSAPPQPLGVPLWDAFVYAEFWSKRDQPASALPLLAQVADRFPDVEPLWERYARLLARAGQHQRASEIYGRLAREDPFRREHYRKLADFYAGLQE